MMLRDLLLCCGLALTLTPILASAKTIPLDKISPPSAVETFREAVRKGLETSPSIKAQENTVRAGEADLSAKRMFWTPTVNGYVTKYVQQGAIGESTGVEVTLNVLKTGSDIAALRAAGSAASAREARLELERFNAETAIASALFDFYLAKSELKYFQRSLELKEETLRFANEKYRRGQYPEQEVARARLDRDRSEISLLEKEITLSNAKDRVRLLTGIRELAKFDWPWLHLLEGDEEVLLKTRAKDRSKTFEQLETRALREEMDAAHQRYMSTKLGYYPRVNLEGIWLNSKAGSTEKGNWSLLLAVRFPLWDKMNTYSEIASQVATRETLRERLQYKKVETEIKEESLPPTLEKNRLAARKALASVKSMQGLLGDSLRRFQLGKSTLNDVFLDEDRFLSAERSLQSALARFHVQLIDACHLANLSILECY